MASLSSSSSSKQAVVFILDTWASMLSTYGGGSTTKATKTMTRLECAKEALIRWISDLMIQSKQNEVAVVVCKTATTDHHLDHEHFPNLTVLPKTKNTGNGSGAGLTRPTISLLQEIDNIECTSSLSQMDETSNDDDDDNHALQQQLRGDLMDGLVVATDALQRRTLGKSYERSIVILTDACHDIVIDEEQVLQVVDALRNVHCRLHVIGLDFVNSAVFEDALPESEAVAAASDADMKQERDSGEDEDENEDTVDDTVDENDQTDDNGSRETIDPRLETERFLISVARLTGGSVQAAHSLHQILQHKLGKRIPTSMRRKCELRVAPTMDPLSVRVSLLVSKTNIPTLKKVATILDEEDEPLKDGLDNYITSDLVRSTDHFDAVNKSIGIDETGRTRAVRFGTDWIPMNDFDLQGLKEPSEINITILGYTNQDKIGRGYIIGPPYGVTGGDSLRSCTALSALAQAMNRLKSCAIGTFVKTKNADPILIALFPLIEPEVAEPHRLVLLQLPFCGDVQKLSTAPLDDQFITHAKQSACDDLIDALMIPPNALESTQIPNPAIRSFHRTVVQRAIDPKGDESRETSHLPIVEARGEWFDVPNLEQARTAIQHFRACFPLENVKGSGK